MPTLLNICKKILAYVLCGCYNKRRKMRYTGYYNTRRRGVNVEDVRSRIHRNSMQCPARSSRRERVPSHGEPCVESKGNGRAGRCKRVGRLEPETWDLFNLEKFCKVPKNGGICWLDGSLSKIITIIETAVKKDTLKPINNDVKYTSSALDVMELFYQIKEATYEHIDADNIGTTYKCVAKILDDFCRCVLHFIDEITKKIKSLQEADGSNRPFKVTPEMCFGINSSEYVHQSVVPFVSKMNLEEISRDLGAVHSETFGSQWHHNLTNTVERTSESAQQKIFDQLDSIVEQMEPTIKKLLLDESKAHKTQHCDGLLEYLSQNFLIMHVQLSVQHFEHMLICVWNCSTTNVRGFLNEETKSSRSVFYKNLNTTLQRLQSFLRELDGSKNITFADVHDILAPKLTKGSSEFIHQYHLERLSQQSSLTSTGVVTVKMYFMNRLLNVEVLNARDIILPATISNGKCNPYIKMQVLPKEKYKSVGKLKTKIQKNTLYPIFDETFLINLTAEQCRVNDAVIRFTLKSHKIFSVTGTFLGEAFVLLSQVPSHSECTVATVQQQPLRLTRPLSSGCYLFHALKDCKSEKVKKFIKKEKLKVNQ